VNPGAGPISGMALGLRTVTGNKLQRRFEMKGLITSVMIAAMVLASGAVVSAQQPGPSHSPGPAAAPGSSAPQPDDQAQHAQHMMEMCRQMMGHSGPMGGMSRGMMGGGMMGGGMTGMMPMMSGDPTQRAEMMAMRGEMMKAMGDIMMKYAERMRPAK
jgi:hypothetical protein